MSDGLPYADILILALVAGFILLRLRSVLGAKQDGEGPDLFKKESRPLAAPESGTIIQLDNKNTKVKPREEFDPALAAITDEKKAAALVAIKETDAQFTVTSFLDGARRAFEMIFDAFAKGDKPTLKMLLSDELYKTFCSEIDAQNSQENKTETTLLSVKPREIAEASLEKNTARIGIKFESEQVTIIKNPAGEVVGGSASDVHHVEDEWIFERDVTSKNPNWKLMET